jgi:hypothetical protein
MKRCLKVAILPGALSAMALTALSALAAKPVEEPVGQVFVTTLPEKAIVSCDGVLRDVSPVTITDLKPGPHIISATKQGHQDARQTVAVRANDKVAVELALEPILGLVLVHSTPAGADVQIGGAFRGKTPLLITDLPIGRHRVQFSKPGHAAREVELVVKDRVPVNVDVNLSSDASSVTVETSPADAKITVDGISKGPSPCNIDIQAGEHVLEVSLDGYQPFKQTFRIAAGRSETMKIDLKELMAELQVVSTPAGAKVYVDNQLKGETPLTISDVKPGALRLRVHAPGYEPMARDITIGRGQKLTEEFGLLSNCGAIEISTVPAGVKVVLDGKDAGTTVARTNDAEAASEVLRLDALQAGRHQLELLRSGYAPRSFSVDVEVGKTAGAKGVRLERRFTPDYEVRTVSEVHKGVLVDKDANGNVKLEIKPGVIVKFSSQDIRFAGPIRRDPAP